MANSFLLLILFYSIHKFNKFCIIILNFPYTNRLFFHLLTVRMPYLRIFYHLLRHLVESSLFFILISVFIDLIKYLIDNFVQYRYYVRKKLYSHSIILLSVLQNFLLIPVVDHFASLFLELHLPT